LGKYFSELELDEKGGQERTCRFSDKKFYITAEDIKFYKKIGVQLPTLSPHESMRKKLGFLNVYNLFFNKSVKTGKRIISAYPENTPYEIWEHQIWHSDEFDPFKYGIEYDFDKSFFEQYRYFQLSVPRPNLEIKNGVNSDYTNGVTDIKNCYLISDGRTSEDCAYSIFLEGSKQIYHSFGQIKSEIGYDNNMVHNSYRVFFSEFSNACVDSSFLFDCRDCTDCFCCTNLRHKKYCFENQQLGKVEYQKKIAEINLGNRNEVAKWKNKFKELKKSAIHRANHNEKNINCTGDYVNNSKNCQACLYVNDGENSKYVVGSTGNKDIYDVTGGHNVSLTYNTMTWWADDTYNTKCSVLALNLRDSEYCDLCQNCSNCFACIGLKNKKFCIFNKQYSEEEYWQKLDEIKTKMLQDGEYGEFFPKELAPIPYNISVATSYGGYDDLEIAKKYGYKIEEVEEPNPDTQNKISIEEVPDDIKDITDDILQKAIIDKNGKKFRYTKEELAFHRKYNLALPVEHYSTILARKRIALGPIDFNTKYRNCTKCGEKTQVTFPENHPDAPTKIYCEKCYNEEIG
jgi:hypothetical protein